MKPYFLLGGALLLILNSCVTGTLPPPPPGQRPEPGLLETLQQAGKEKRGTITHIQDFSMTELGTQRDIWIYTPPGYDEQESRYPVIYMHDGQNLFFRDLAFSGEWMVDEVMDGLYALDVFPGAIVVAVANGGERRVSEYSPYPTDFNGMETLAVEYLLDLVNLVKPWVEENYRVLPDGEYHSLAGSSLGGLISLYAPLVLPGEFKNIIAMSPSIWVADASIIQEFSRQNPGVEDLRVYLDMGTAEGNENVSLTRQMAELLRKQGAEDLKLVIDEGAGHNETSWRERLPELLAWLYGFSLE